MVVSLVALSIAVGGSATAATTLITGRQIKDGTVAKADLTPSLRNQINVRQLRGLPGPAGLTGLTGLTGAPGGFDPAKVTYVAGPSSTLNPNDVVIVQAFCPPGTEAIGGGHFSIGNKLASVAIPDGSGWEVLIANDPSIVTTDSAFAVCAAP